MEGSPLHDPVQHQNTPTARHRVVWWALASECGVARFRAPHVKPEIIRSISGHHTEQLRELVLDLPLAGEARRYRQLDSGTLFGLTIRQQPSETK